MVKKVSLSVLSVFMTLLIALTTLVFTGCGRDEKENYNIIVAVASIPPVIASLECIQNGNDTYAYIERGKTYSGIAQVEQFENLGFNASANAQTGITAEMTTNVVSAIEQILARDENAFINLYCVDYNALAVYAMAIKAGVNENNFKVIMIEDGSGAYSDIYDHYVKDMENADAAYTNYTNKVAQLNQTLAEIKNSNGQTGYTVTDNSVAIALASFDNFEFIIQSNDRVKDTLNKNANIAGSKLYTVFGVNGYNQSVKKANIVYKSISEYVAELTPAQKEAYLTLMFGTDREVTENLFSRTTVAGQNVPAKKLVYIGGRVCQSGVGNMAPQITDLSQLGTYNTALSDIKELFNSEADYNILLNAVNNSTNSDGAKIAMVNYYLKYIYTLKLTYRLYGAEYDILFKGHPREIVNDITTWADTNYRVNIGSEENPNYDVYTQSMYNLINAFYTQDSEGKFIGILPGGVAAENFAYLGYDFALGGLSSSTYTGYETDVIVEFILNETATIQTESNVATRYENGTLVWTKGTNTEYTTLMLNAGNVYKAFIEYYANNAELKTKYETMLDAWLIANKEEVNSGNVANYTVDRQGNIVQK